MKVKICGITTVEDGKAALDFGADMLGFNFYEKSPRHIDTESCASIVRALRERKKPFIAVGVFVNMDSEELRSIVKTCGLDQAQLCGDEDGAYLFGLRLPAYKAIRPRDRLELDQATNKFSARLSRGWNADATMPDLLIDAYRPGEHGGTGELANWELAAQAALDYPILLAGGLDVTNVTQAIRKVRPWGVDVASGIESEPGVKSLRLMSEFIEKAKTTF